MFREAVFQRVEGDDTGPPAGHEGRGEHVFQGAFDVLQLVVDEDAEGLEDPGRRVLPAVPADLAGNGRLDRGDEVGDGADRVPVSTSDDLRGDRAGVSFLAVVLQGPCDLVGFERFESFVGRLAPRLVEPQVERAVRAEAEPAAALQLVGGEAEVEQHAVGVVEPEFGEDVEEVGMGGVDEVGVRSGDLLGGEFEHRRVAVESDEGAGVAEAFQEGGRVPSAAHGAVDDDLPWLDVEEVQHLPQQHGTMDGTA